MINHDINPFMNDEYDLTKKILTSHINSKSSCTIGKIVSVNASPVSVNIEPVIKYFDKIEGFTDNPILQNIPIAQISNSFSSVRMPLNPGDVGIIFWFDREVYSWLKNPSDAQKSPDSGNMFNDAACIFFPFIQKFSQAPQVKSTGVDLLSSNVSLMTELITTMNNLTTTLTDITSLLTDLTTYCASVIATPTNPVPAFIDELVAATVVLEASLVPIASSISTVTTSIGNITTRLTTFKGAQ